MIRELIEIKEWTSKVVRELMWEGVDTPGEKDV